MFNGEWYLLFYASQSNTGVLTAKAEGIGQSDVHLALACRVGDVVQVAGRVGLLVADGRGQYAVLDGQGADNQLYGSGSAKHVSQHRFGGTDLHLAGNILAQRLCWCHGR